MTDYRSDLQHFIDNHLPAVQRLEFAIEQANTDRVVLSAPLSANINDKLTAFGGSQQMLALTCCWSLIYINMIDAGLKDSQFVVAEVNTRYLRPVKTDTFYAVSEIDPELFRPFAEGAGSGVSTRISNEASVYAADQIDITSPQLSSCGKASTVLTANFATIKS